LRYPHVLLRDVIRVCTDPEAAYIMDNVLNTLCDVSRIPSCGAADHACVVCLVWSSFQGSAPLKPADVAAMVDHRNKVGYGDVIVYHNAGEEACLEPAEVLVTLQVVQCTLSSSSSAVCTASRSRYSA